MDVGREIAHIWECDDGPDWRGRICDTIPALKPGGDDSDSCVLDD